jgi:hypothetical protein
LFSPPAKIAADIFLIFIPINHKNINSMIVCLPFPAT